MKKSICDENALVAVPIIDSAKFQNKRVVVVILDVFNRMIPIGMPYFSIINGFILIIITRMSTMIRNIVNVP